jgi:hypothetical protein
MADAMAKDTVHALSAEQREEMERIRKEAFEAISKAAEEAEKKIVKSVEDATEMIRAACLLISDTAEKITTSGFMGHLDKATQRFLQNMQELEKDYQAELVGSAGGVSATAAPITSIDPLLAAFTERAAKEKEERLAKEAAERAAKAAAAAAAASPVKSTGSGSVYDEETGEWVEQSVLDQREAKRVEERKKEEAERSKVDAFFEESIF